jgi:hypothetical protein
MIFGISESIFAQKVIVNAYMAKKNADKQSDTIYYVFNRPLTWNDFRGKPVANYFPGAVTASGFAFDSRMEYDGHTLRLDISIYPYFTKHDYWKKPDINSAYHLLHEQHHFDITRIGAQQFLNAVQNAHFSINNYKSLLTRLFDKAYDCNVAMQREYDRETSHSLNVTKQLEWDNKIEEEVLRLKQGMATND